MMFCARAETAIKPTKPKADRSRHCFSIASPRVNPRLGDPYQSDYGPGVVKSALSFTNLYLMIQTVFWPFRFPVWISCCSQALLQVRGDPVAQLPFDL